ncbi:MAG: hypothetical protein JJT89_09440 [Nitriliruptoraceae bacterium]|nr:hypothetical protein [Nitriliruptoraceae bacterium]
MRCRSWVGVLPTSSLVALALVVSVLPVPAEAATPAGTLDDVAAELPLFLDLGLSTPRHVLGGDGEVYVTIGDELLVIDLAGDLVTRIEGLPGAGPMALTPDGESLFVGLRGSASVPGAELVLFDVEDLDEVWRWELPARPRSVLATEDLVHIGVGHPTDSDDRSALVTIRSDEHAVGPGQPVLATPLLARDQHGLIVGHASINPSRISRRTLAGDPLDPPVERQTGGQMRDVAVDPVTGAIWTAVSGQVIGPTQSVHALDPDTFETVRSIHVGPAPYAVAPIGDGRHVAAARITGGLDEVTIHRLHAGSTDRIAAHEVPGEPVAQGLSMTSDGGLAVLSAATGSAPRGWLTLIPYPTRALPELVPDVADAIAGQPFQIAGLLRGNDGIPIAGVPISLIDPRNGPSQTTTDGGGRYRFTVPGGPRDVAQTFRVLARGDTDRQSVAIEQTVVPRRGTSTPLLDDRTFIAGHPATLRGRVVGEAALPRAGVVVTLERDGQPLGTVSTDADGAYRFVLTEWAQGTVTITARIAEDDTHLAGTTTWTFPIVRDHAPLRIDAISGTARTSVPLTGRALDGLGRPAPDRLVDLRIDDQHGVRVTRRITSGADGRWATSFTPRNGGHHTVTASTAPTARFGAALQTRDDVHIRRVATAASLASLPSTVDHGHRLTLIGRVDAPAGAMLDLVEVDLASGTERRIARAQVDSTGRLRREVTARANTRYEVRFRGDTAHAPSTTTRTVRVRARVTAQIAGHDRTVNGVPSFRYAARPTVTGRVRAVDPSRRVQVILQQRRDGAWVTAAGWDARPDADGRVQTRAPFALTDGRYRVRTSTSESRATLQGRSPWVELRVRP